MNRTWPRLGIAVAIVFIIVDQATKLAVVNHFFVGEQLSLAPLLSLTLVYNKGGAFSMLANLPAALRVPLFSAVAAAALWFCWYYWKQSRPGDRLVELSLGLVASGALGNLADRLRLGEVIDFIQVDIPLGAMIGWLGDWVPAIYTWPIFNVADSAVFCGVGFLMWRAFTEAKPASDDASDPA